MQVTSTSFRAYALDLWGFGDTAPRTERYSLEKQTELVSSFLDEMGIGKVALVGHGWGAIIALNFAVTNASKVDRVMVVNCPLEMDNINSRLFKDSTEKLANWLSNDLPNVQAALGDAKKADPVAVQNSRNGFSASDLFNDVNRQHTPCLLVSGDQDPLVGLPNNLELSSLLSDFGQHVILEGAGYFPMLDSTAKFNRLLTDFLALDSGLSIKELGLKEEWRRRVR